MPRRLCRQKSFEYQIREMYRALIIIAMAIFMLSVGSSALAASGGDVPSAWAKADVEKGWRQTILSRLGLNL